MLETKSLEFDFSSLSNINETLKLIILRDAITLANIDKEFSKEEKDFVYCLADSMGIDRQKVDEIYVWLKNLWAAIDEGDKIFGGI